jgi:hypothetical protein
MQRFVARENIRRFKEMLAGETRAEARALLQQMIEAEEAKLKGPSNGQASESELDHD